MPICIKFMVSPLAKMCSRMGPHNVYPSDVHNVCRRQSSGGQLMSWLSRAQRGASSRTHLYSSNESVQGSQQVNTSLVYRKHVATEAEPILSHLFGAEFGLEILLETGRLSSQLFSDWSVLCCSRTKLGSKNCHTIFGAEFGAAAPLLSQRAHTAHAFESQKPPL